MPSNENKAFVRLLNASPNTPAVDITVNEVLIADNLAFKSFTEYMPAEAGVYRIHVTPNGLNSELSATELVELMPGGIYTMAVAGLETDLTIELIDDELRAKPNGRAFVRFINLSPYDTEFDVMIGNAPVVTALAYTESSRYTPLQAGTYSLRLFNSRDNRLVLTNPHMQVQNGHFYAVYIVGLEAGSPPLQVLIPLEGATYLR